jgi:hypothetical protein
MVMALTESLPGPASPPPDDPAVRDERLHASLLRSRRAGVAISERWLFTIGGALAVGGIALVIVGWAGTSRTVLVAGQIPYLVSGGLLGLALVFLGGFLYFGYWLAVLVRESGERGESDRADFERLRSGLEQATVALESVVRLMQSGEAGAPVVASAGHERLVATSTGTMVHRADCPAVAGRDNVRVVDDIGSLKPCSICNPA